MHIKEGAVREMRKARKSFEVIALALVMCVITSLFAGCGEPKGEMRDMTTMEITRDMGLGINLGNTFESCGGWISSTSVTNY